MMSATLGVLQSTWYPGCRAPWGSGMWILWLLWPLLIGGLAWIIAQRVRSAQRVDAVEVLKRRYARGEIDVETYSRMLDTLRR